MNPTVTRRLGWLMDHPWAVVGGIFVVALTWWAIGTRTQDHHVRATFPSALNLTSGQSIYVDGVEAGKITGVEYEDGHAVVELGIADDYWPLRAGATLKSRWGTTIGSGTRRIDLELGPKNAPEIPENGAIAAKQAQAAVDVDAVLNTLTKRTQGQLQSWQAGMDAALAPSSKHIREAFSDSDDGVAAVEGVLSDLEKDTSALRALVANGDRFTKTLATRRDGVSDLITFTARTFETLAARSAGMEQSIAELPPTLTEATRTLARVDTSVGNLDRLVSDLGPGAAKLVPLAQAAGPAMRELRTTVPSARSLVQRVTRSAPRLTRLLQDGTTFVPRLGGVFHDLAPMMACIRPYAPEAGGAVIGMGGWDHYYTMKPQGTLESTALGDPPKAKGRTVDGKVRQHYGRALAQASTTSMHAWPSVVSPAAFAKLTGKQYSMPRPPGLGVKQPWFQPECGITPDALDPSKDPEQGTSK